VSLSKLAKWPPVIRIDWALTFVTMIAFACLPVSADQPALTSGLSSPDVAQQEASNAHQGVIPTRAGLQLIVKAGCVNVQIFTDRSDSVSYLAQFDPSAGHVTRDSLQNFVLTARNTARGVMLFDQTPREHGCRGDLILQIHVPHHYDLNVAVESGNIVTQDVDGIVAFSSGGGEIRAGNIGTSVPVKAFEHVPFVARFETAGGNICVGNIAGGLRASTGGGQISVGDVHGSAILRTGGGDIHVGHIFGAAQFTSAGGDIVAKKIYGGVWADTAGGRIEIGDGARLASAAPGVSASWMQTMQALQGGLPRPADDQQEISAMTDLAEISELERFFDAFLWGALRIEPGDQQRRLIHSIAPEYPDVARLAGIEGDVTLRILVSEDGTIGDITPLSGPPILARAAIRAVEHWRYAPVLVDGRPVGVVSTITLAFRLHP
jgi:TonB family protein